MFKLAIMVAVAAVKSNGGHYGKATCARHVFVFLKHYTAGTVAIICFCVVYSWDHAPAACGHNGTGLLWHALRRLHLVKVAPRLFTILEHKL